MRTGRPLPEVLTELQRQQAAKRDYISPSSSLAYHDGQLTMDHVGPKDGMAFGMTDLFHRQVGAALSIPAKYYDLMRREKPELLAQNVNSWLASRETSYMIRTMDGLARAFLSDHYRRIDNLEVASATLPLFAGVEGLEVMSSEVTEHRLYLKVVDHRREVTCVGDRVQFGIVISNSEVGLGAVSVQPLVYTLACTNGMIVNTLGERKTHVGRQVRSLEESFAVYSDETMEAEDRVFLLKLRDVATSAFDEARQNMIVDKLTEAAGAKINGRVQDVVELTGRNFGLSLPEQDDVLNYLIQGGDLSLYGLSNAITRASQDVASYDRATEMESIGWTVATMPARQWKEINNE